MKPDSPSAAPVSSSAETSRRRLLALGGAGGAAALAGLLSRDEAQAGHDGSNTFHLGQQNFSGAPTGLTLNTGAGGGPAGPALALSNPSGGALGCSTQAVAAFGPGVAAVHASGTQVGLEGISMGEGADDPQGFRHIGVAGRSQKRTGVEGTSQSGTGVRAHSAQGPALAVDGRLEFSSAGQGNVPEGANSAFVGDSRVTPFSQISVTLQSNPGPRALSWVEVSPGCGFTVHLTPAPRGQRRRAFFTYFFYEPRPTGNVACPNP